MSLLLSSERSLADSRTLSPFKLVSNWIADTRAKAARRANLLSLLAMEDHRLTDLGLSRAEVQASINSGRPLRRSRSV